MLTPTAPERCPYYTNKEICALTRKKPSAIKMGAPSTISDLDAEIMFCTRRDSFGQGYLHCAVYARIFRIEGGKTNNG